MRMFIILCIICSLKVNVFGISIKIDGSIDLGPKWNYRYALTEMSTPKNLRGNDEEAGKNSYEKDDIHDMMDRKIINDAHRAEVQRFERKKKKRSKKDYKRKRTTEAEKASKSLENDSAFHRHREKMIERAESKSGQEENTNYYRVTEMDNYERNGDKNEIFVKAQKVKEVPSVNHFILHIYKQALKFFDAIKKKISSKNQKLRQQVKKLRSAYKRVFAHFLNETKDHVIKTNSGANRVILNAINTSNRILKRLVNQIPDITQIDLFQRELNRQIALEDHHACYKMNICRSSASFSSFLMSALIIFIQSNDAKLKQGSDALTESLKTADFTSFISPQTQDNFRHVVKSLEYWPAFVVRAFYMILMTALNNKDMPIYVMHKEDAKVANNTVAFREFVNIFDKSDAKGTMANDWKEIINRLEQWKDGKRKDILEIMEMFVAAIKKAMEMMPKEVLARINQLMDMMFKVQIISGHSFL